MFSILLQFFFGLWHIRNCSVVFAMFNTDIKSGLERWFIETWECVASIGCFKLRCCKPTVDKKINY